ncbi:MAG: hypothetical protein GKR97_04980 [Rhizobiaceae bacterium]|nr:hypothetical protein [Rhizobiaceae bacterium]
MAGEPNNPTYCNRPAPLTATQPPIIAAAKRPIRSFRSRPFGGVDEDDEGGGGGGGGECGEGAFVLLGSEADAEVFPGEVDEPLWKSEEEVVRLFRVSVPVLLSRGGTLGIPLVRASFEVVFAAASDFLAAAALDSATSSALRSMVTGLVFFDAWRAPRGV